MTYRSQRRRAWQQRRALLAHALGHPGIDQRDPSQVWLALTTLSGVFPTEAQVLDVVASPHAGALTRAVARATTPLSARYHVRIAIGETLVDVADSVATPAATGIQRVVREVAKRWYWRADATFVAWDARSATMRAATAAEALRIRQGTARSGADPYPEVHVVVPWRSNLVELDVFANYNRTPRLAALARFAQVATSALGYDLIPITSSETSELGMAGLFPRYLAALKYFDRLCTISEATAVEFRGWRRMVRATGVAGPEIVPLLLPAEAGSTTPAAVAEVQETLDGSGWPLVLVVGSTEPRKNHLAVLRAAQALWDEGLAFALIFIGGNTWHSDEFRTELARLAALGRPVQRLAGVSDEFLWAAYRLARFTVFPSFNEGFGLPVAESLAVGTPVITTCYGSTREIADGGGALLVNPRSDAEITEAMRRLLTDDALLAHLRTQAGERPPSSWDQYAARLWDALVPVQDHVRLAHEDDDLLPRASEPGGHHERGD